MNNCDNFGDLDDIEYDEKEDLKLLYEQLDSN